MEDQTAILSGSLQADPFETQMRGYNKRQVDDYITRTNEQLAGLEARMVSALDTAERARLEVAAVREQHQQEQQQAALRPAHEEVSERLSQILRLAAEEAEQERSKAEAEIARMREEADVEVEALRTRVRSEVDDVLASARREADAELAHARAEAEQLLASSRQESDRTLGEAREHAERLRSQAERRAAAVNGVLDQRLAAITEAHGTAVRRLTEIRETLGGLLAADFEAGSISAVVPPAEPAEMEDVAAAREQVASDGAGAVTAVPDPDLADVVVEELIDGPFAEPVAERVTAPVAEPVAELVAGSGVEPVAGSVAAVVTGPVTRLVADEDVITVADVAEDAPADDDVDLTGSAATTR